MSGIKITKKLLLLLCLFLQTTGSVLYTYADDVYEGPPNVESFAEVRPSASTLVPPSISAGAAVVMDVKSGRVLYEKKAYTKMAMASTTKIMTAIIALEKGKLDDIVTVSEKASQIWGSVIGIRPGEKFTLREMLYGLMLNSGNDAAIAIAEHIGGTVENFLKMMNEKAEELGADNTFFQTPHGLDAPDHYTTAYDLALITRHALGIPVFAEIVRTVTTSISGISLYNTNELLGWYQGADGVKTGYTGKAGRCLVASATRDNWKLISVVLLCSTRTERAYSSKKILDYAFDNFRPYVLARKNERIAGLEVERGFSSFLEVLAPKDIEMPLSADEIGSLEIQTDLPEKLKAPVQSGVEIGSVKYIASGKVLCRLPLITEKDIARKDFFYYLETLLKAVRSSI